MLLKTHTSVGVAAALLINPPATIPMLGAAIAVSAVSGAISDIDEGPSKVKNSFDKLIGLLFVLTLAITIFVFMGAGSHIEGLCTALRVVLC